MPNTEKIRALNDAFRKSFRGGNIFVTPGVTMRQDLPEIVQRVRNYDGFGQGNDPHREHDFGALKIGEDVLFWKIDCYDVDMQYGSLDPSDPAVTCRVMTIMLAEEY
jgi:hypothetical protein